MIARTSVTTARVVATIAPKARDSGALLARGQTAKVAAVDQVVQAEADLASAARRANGATVKAVAAARAAAPVDDDPVVVDMLRGARSARSASTTFNTSTTRTSDAFAAMWASVGRSSHDGNWEHVPGISVP